MPGEIVARAFRLGVTQDNFPKARNREREYGCGNQEDNAAVDPNHNCRWGEEFSDQRLRAAALKRGRSAKHNCIGKGGDAKNA
jgi:hypothetical protein